MGFRIGEGLASNRLLNRCLVDPSGTRLNPSSKLPNGSNMQLKPKHHAEPSGCHSYFKCSSVQVEVFVSVLLWK